MADEKPSLFDTAHEVFLEDEVAEIALRNLINKITLSDELREQAIHLAATESLAAARLRIRRRMKEGFAPITYSKDEQESVRKGCNRFLGLLDWPMMDGSRLGDANKKLLLSDTDRYVANAKGNMVSASFLKLVAERLSEGQKVSEVWTESELKEVMKKAKTSSRD